MDATRTYVLQVEHEISTKLAELASYVRVADAQFPGRAGRIDFVSTQQSHEQYRPQGPVTLIRTLLRGWTQQDCGLS